MSDLQEWAIGIGIVLGMAVVIPPLLLFVALSLSWMFEIGLRFCKWVMQVLPWPPFLTDKGGEG